MAKNLMRGVILVFLTCVFFASLVSSNEKTGTCCSEGLGLNYTLPMFNECKKELHSNGSMVQTIPKLIPYTSQEAACPRRKSKLGIPPGHRMCRFPDCGENPCQNGWCAETMKNFKCHCSAGYRGKRCNQESTTTQDTPTMSSTKATTSHPVTTTQSTTTQDTTTMSTMESTTSHPTTTTQSTTTQETTTMSPFESTTSRPTTTTKSTAKIFVTDEGTQNKIFVADLQDNLDFTDIPSTEEPRYITYDSVEKKIYWTDKGTKRVYRADVDGENRDTVTSENDKEPRGIAIAESSRTLYIAYEGSKKITTVDIEQGSIFPGDETDFVTASHDPYSLKVDEEQGFLYWSMYDKIHRKRLDGSGDKDDVYHNHNSNHEITGLSIDISRNPRRIFFCEYSEARSFYMDVNQSPATAHELTDYMNDADISGEKEREKLRDISYFDGTLYWAKEDNPSAIAIMTEYDQSSPSFDIKEINGVIEKPFQLLIINP